MATITEIERDSKTPQNLRVRDLARARNVLLFRFALHREKGQGITWPFWGPQVLLDILGKTDTKGVQLCPLLGYFCIVRSVTIAFVGLYMSFESSGSIDM